MPGASSTNRRTPEYDFTINLLNTHPWLEPIRDEAITRFWETLCLDSLIGNFDRHAGNWGYLADWNNRTALSVAPIYDCGSAFYPRLGEPEMERLTRLPDELGRECTTFPMSDCLLMEYAPIMMTSCCQAKALQLEKYFCILLTALTSALSTV